MSIEIISKTPRFRGVFVFVCSGQPVSRLLSPLRGSDHLSVPPVARGIKQHTRRFLRDGSPQCACLALLPVGFTWPRTSLPAPGVSYTAVSPSPFSGQYTSLLHFPSGCPAWPLASTVPYGGRTFLVPEQAETRSPGQPEHLFIIMERCEP